MKLVSLRSMVFLIAYLVMCYFSSLIGASAGSVRRDPFLFDANDVDHEKLVIAEKKEKFEDNEGDFMHVDYTPVREKPPIHN
ncbi:hypothetical protein Lal_00019163 [Lupinus albus]|nr:hypothetical protein Lal_00019163 [Lupinus albus]